MLKDVSASQPTWAALSIPIDFSMQASICGFHNTISWQVVFSCTKKHFCAREAWRKFAAWIPDFVPGSSRSVFVRVNKHLVNEQDFPCTVFEAWIWGEAAVILLWQKVISWSLSWNDFALLNMIGSRWHGRLCSANQTSCSTHMSWDICQSWQKWALCAER